MSKVQIKFNAKQWAMGMAADLLRSDLAMAGPIEENDPLWKEKMTAMYDVINDLRLRSGQSKLRCPSDLGENE